MTPQEFAALVSAPKTWELLFALLIVLAVGGLADRL
jgi:hypothetical protein